MVKKKTSIKNPTVNKDFAVLPGGGAKADRQMSPSEQQRIMMVNERFNLAYRNQYPYFTDFDRYYKMYESYVNENSSIWQTKIFIPIVFSVIERFLPRLISSKPTVNFMARNENTVDKAQKMQSLFEWQWDQVSRVRDGGMYMEILRYVKDALVLGTAIAKVPWRLQGQDTKYYNESNEVAVKFVKHFDGPDFQLIDPYDFFIDPEALDIQRASWVVHRTRRTLDEMREINKAKGAEIYKNLDLLENAAPDTYASNESDFKQRRKVSMGSAQVLTRDTTTDKFELLECWGMFPKLDENGQPTKNGELEPRVITLASRSTIVRDVPYPYWHGKKPFIAYTPFPRSYEFYGIPMVKHIERIQFYINEFISQKFDNQVIELNQMLVVAPQANLEDWQLMWRPGGVIRANPDHIKPLALGDVTGGIDTSVQYLSSVVQLTTGLSDYYTSGTNADSSQNKTATGANIIEEQIAIRIKQAMQVLEEQVIKEIGYQWHGLDGQFIKLPQVVRVIGPDGKPDFPLVDTMDIRESFDVVPEAGSTQPVNEALQRQQFLNVIQLIQSNPVMAQQTDWQTVEKELWRRFGFKEGDRLMVTTPGSNPQLMPGGQEIAGGTAGQPNLPNQTNPADMMAAQLGGQAGYRQGISNSPQVSQQGAPIGEDSTVGKIGKVSVKFSDLTAQEQAQYLQMMGIQPDMASRYERLAQEQDEHKADRTLDMMDRVTPKGNF